MSYARSRELEGRGGVIDFGTTWEFQAMRTSTDLVRQLLDAMTNSGLGFQRRRRVPRGTWHETVTHYTPEPWRVALDRDKTGLPVRPGHRPGASR